MGRNSQPPPMDELIPDFAGHFLVSSRYPCHVLIDVPFVQCEAVINLLVLSREWMGMGEWGNGIIITIVIMDHSPFPTKHQ